MISATRARPMFYGDSGTGFSTYIRVGTLTTFGTFPKTSDKCLCLCVSFLTSSVCFLCRCHDCGAILEEYDEETLGLAIVVLSTFIHLSPDLAAPLLLDIMQSVGR